MESRIISNIQTVKPDHKLWLYKSSNNIWMKSKNNLVLVYRDPGSYGLDFGSTLSSEVLKNDGWKPFFGTVELKE